LVLPAPSLSPVLEVSSNFASLLPHVVPWSLVAFRVLGLFMLTPVLTSTMLPTRFKALLGFMLGAAAYPMLLARPETSGFASSLGQVDDVFSMIVLVLAEAAVGFCIGAIAATPLLMLELGGLVMGNSMGFGLARVYSPEADVDTDLLGQLLFTVATGVFIAAGGLEQLFKGVVESFAYLPLGTFHAGLTPMEAFVGVLGSGTELGLRVAAPVTCIVLMLTIVFGVLGKTMPQLNVMSVGFTVKMLGGLAMLVLGLAAMKGPIEEHMGHAFGEVFEFVRGLKPAAHVQGGA
jgi:flagellar biosynthetic protein FliR